jgi:hypothetical protein
MRDIITRVLLLERLVCMPVVQLVAETPHRQVGRCATVRRGSSIIRVDQISFVSQDRGASRLVGEGTAEIRSHRVLSSMNNRTTGHFRYSTTVAQQVLEAVHSGERHS